MKMTWAEIQWYKWGNALGWYKAGLNANGKAQYISQDIQIKHPRGAIVCGRVDVLEPLNIGSEDEIWRLDIVLPGYCERWEASRGNHIAHSTYLLGDDAGDAGKIRSWNHNFNNIQDFARFAAEYLQSIDLMGAYSSFRRVMRHF